MRLEYQVLSAIALDLALGDPRWIPHPVRWIGRFAASMETPFRRRFGNPRTAGTVAWFVVLLATLLGAFLLVRGAHRLHPWAVDGVSILLIYFSIAARDLVGHGEGVRRALEKGELPGAREKVGMIVGRDTDRLDEAGVVRAAVESVAENIVDGITAPLFYAALFGPLGAIGYRAINTMDSLFGYRNERYIDFGRTSARVDDVANFFPARVTGLLVPPAAFLLRLRASDAFRIFLRDRRNHPSPNSGHTEAAVAGALGVQLGGESFYGGRSSFKPLLGDPAETLNRRHIRQVNVLALTASALAVVLFLGSRLLVTACCGAGGVA
ncbi:MAG: adenosylcobinamide-phosphate synthase CbiB [Deltaproteobacteria bacterium]|nr:adenosylcobinamide-phosphate synthase CbiB [Deltaproteobacteria bacterium]